MKYFYVSQSVSVVAKCHYRKLGRLGLSHEFREQRFGLRQITRLEPLREPPVNRSEQFASLLRLALVAPEACEAHGCA